MSDSVQISDAARNRPRRRTEPIAAERIERIRQQIAGGTYETDERVSAAASALARVLSPSG